MTYDVKNRVKRKKISPVLKWRLASDQKFMCKLCDTMLGDDVEVDHIIPIFLGGNNTMSNLQVIHSRCHSRKTYIETVSRNSNKEPFCDYCDLYFSKYFIRDHIHA